MEIPFCKECGFCKCKICDLEGNEYYVKTTLIARDSVKIETYKIEVKTIVDKEGQSKTETILSDNSSYTTGFNERGQLMIEGYQNCLPYDDHCNCN